MNRLTALQGLMDQAVKYFLGSTEPEDSVGSSSDDESTTETDIDTSQSAVAPTTSKSTNINPATVVTTPVNPNLGPDDDSKGSDPTPRKPIPAPRKSKVSPPASSDNSQLRGLNWGDYTNPSSRPSPPSWPAGIPYDSTLVEEQVNLWKILSKPPKSPPNRDPRNSALAEIDRYRRRYPMDRDFYKVAKETARTHPYFLDKRCD